MKSINIQFSSLESPDTFFRVYTMPLLGIEVHDERWSVMEAALFGFAKAYLEDETLKDFHTQAFSIHRDIFKNTWLKKDLLHGNVKISQKYIILEAYALSGEEWELFLTHDILSSHCYTHEKNRALALSRLNAQREKYRENMNLSKIFRDSHCLDEAMVEKCIDYAIFCAIAQYASKHALDLPHNHVIDYFYEIVQRARKNALGRCGSRTWVHPHSEDFFQSGYLAFRNPQSERSFDAQEGFEDYCQSMPASWMNLGAQLAPFAFMIHERTALGRAFDLIGLGQKNSPPKAYERIDGKNLSNHDIMTLLHVEMKVRDFVSSLPSARLSRPFE